MRVRLLGAALIAVLIASCGLDNGLGGSMGDVFPLDVSKVDIHENDEALQITYLRNRGVFLDVVVRVSVSIVAEGVAEDGGVPKIDLKPGTKIDLKGMAPNGQLRAAVTTAPGGEPVRNMPHIARGDLVINRGGKIGELTGGSFSMLFEKEGGDVGYGRTLTGTFSAIALDAGFEPNPPTP